MGLIGVVFTKNTKGRLEVVGSPGCELRYYTKRLFCKQGVNSDRNYTK